MGKEINGFGNLDLMPGKIFAHKELLNYVKIIRVADYENKILIGEIVQLDAENTYYIKNTSVLFTDFMKDIFYEVTESDFLKVKFEFIKMFEEELES